MGIQTMDLQQAKLKISKHKGIQLHGSSIRLLFTYKGERCAETLKNVPLTEKNIEMAANKRTSICYQIEVGTFDYIANFPNSKKALKMFNDENNKMSVPFDVFMSKALKLSESTTREKSFYNFKNRAENYIIPAFHGRCLTTITVSEIKALIAEQLDHLANKTIGEVLTPLRATFNLAYEDDLLEKNPMSYVTNPKKGSVDNADPFTKAEIKKLANVGISREIEQLAVIFACWTGLRPSELLALSLSDIDLSAGTITVNRSVVKGVYAATKTDGSFRTVELLDQAKEALEKLLALRTNATSRKVNVLARDNRRAFTEELQFLVVSSESSSPWSGNESFSKMIMKPLCKQAGVRYRAIGQARHTYGSQLITAGMPLKWIAVQMGHKSIKMLEKHYGRWMKSEAPDMAKQASVKLAS
ncbi:Arm DNA-binding domain-containing protein [Glaciecola sp. MF2-115]|uniref:Arm DNA-binding domain-containing protein n=1 Tax=Glaciecola sp. MF2-115 TaxID=3384827 RepID=UPI00399F64A0